MVGYQYSTAQWHNVSRLRASCYSIVMSRQQSESSARLKSRPRAAQPDARYLLLPSMTGEVHSASSLLSCSSRSPCSFSLRSCSSYSSLLTMSPCWEDPASSNRLSSQSLVAQIHCSYTFDTGKPTASGGADSTCARCDGEVGDLLSETIFLLCHQRPQTLALLLDSIRRHALGNITKLLLRHSLHRRLLRGASFGSCGRRLPLLWRVPC